MSRLWARPGRGDDGRISILIVGLFALLGILVMGGVDVTAVQLSRMHLIDVADAAAVDAADAIDDPTVYQQGVGSNLRLTDRSVGTVAGSSLAQQKKPAHITSWGLIGGTGTTDGRTAVVRLRGNVRPPLLGGFMSFFDADISITVESRARADVGG
ncbi:pilus assembly protein TadG-related protein [Luteipulveratus mongoliensis]|uniref:Putative Flp pilus-assembly TadG-like N-terminal domain-containing protein n=1 Tax=Luteipulveratus mongoliensis TaxID=571913 RepID=A0A0K1JHT6_9MICO|nr:pilus assembly protein TadG-related protein [Luteipulveratus mongoliensis]AKU16261.1 hypothetical protein VV02_10950 [Luteipulveratus mongoliensis]